MTTKFEKTFTATPAHIDALGHVNNAVWVQWIQDLATHHWDAVARPADQEAFFWVVTRHEIDYRGNISVGDNVIGTSWIEGKPRGATSIRRVEFHNMAGKKIVSAATTWAMLDRTTRQLMRVREDILAPFRD